MRAKYSGIKEVKNTFDLAKAELDRKGCRMISLEDYANLNLIQTSRTLENFIYVPGIGVYLSKYSPILEDPKKATDSHRHNGQGEFYLSKDQVFKSLKTARMIVNRKIPTDQLGVYPETSYMFGKSAYKYGLYLHDKGIKNLEIWTCDYDQVKARPFARQACLEYRERDNQFILNSMNLNAQITTLGIKKTN
jgi:hypothetical protein